MTTTARRFIVTFTTSNTPNTRRTEQLYAYSLRHACDIVRENKFWAERIVIDVAHDTRPVSHKERAAAIVLQNEFCATGITPTTNTEAAQLDADLAETPHALTCLCRECCYADVDTLDFQPAMLDPIQSLPLFSGTAPRVADPGRYDPPAASLDTQPQLF